MNEIAVDYGRKRTGFAIYLVGTVLPLPPLTETTWNGIADRLKHIQNENGTSRIILGLPLTAAGKPTELSNEVEKLSDYLEKMGFNVELVRETSSTAETEVEARVNHLRDGKRDSLAAMVILKRYLGMP
ncbi:MAG: pre-16S rRNA-processing nuclease YqgF [Candidatus Aegiribacteria sp.]|nr:pre-16S rRNA-processing nuclease YqgF [Candidatus Aegiribacteria sp.]